MAKDYYKILDIPRTATQEEVKKAYKRQSKIFHPDRNKDISKEEAESRFSDIAEAWEVLGDAEKRRVFDQSGYEAVKQKEQNDAARGVRKGKTKVGRVDTKPGPDLYCFMEIDLEEIYTGADVQADIVHQITCPRCTGSGAAKGGMTTCPKCQGQGVYLANAQIAAGFGFQIQKECEQCGATGVIVSKKCGKCKGAGTIVGTDTHVFFIDRGAHEGEEMRYDGMGDAAKGFDTGSLVIRLFEDDSGRFKRTKDDLFTSVNISIRDALLGFTLDVRHMDGHNMTISRENMCTFDGEQVRLEGEGMTRSDSTSFGTKGDLFVTFHITFPQSLTKEQRSLVEQLFPATEKTPDSTLKAEL
ncbi:putative Chaperone protein DnaJ [Blattamonas nauphoetae]|uniref:Chaperone protein DnaJ n=1 Tax=Blattamonas nauphoetae TaxID=2049346 RepID=A0ABQ9XEA7_9EUKA|nr:putative Chaperone protein DnaJ [Blattamonas nauphoetae]